ncbi:UNVERIFIED_CONTAM: hypothetical protein K2H54_025544 [Gekko kuhli]
MAAPLLLWALAALLAAPSLARSAAANASAAPTAVQEVRLGVLLPERNLRYPWAWPRVAPALRLALEALQPQQRPAGLALRTAFASTEKEDGACDESVVIFQASDLHSSQDPDALVGLGCSRNSWEVEPYAWYWSLPLLKAGAYWRNQDFGGTMVYGGPAGPGGGAFQEQLLRHFHWTSLPVLVISPEIYWREYSSLLNSEDAPWVTPTSKPRIHLYEEPGDEAVRLIRAHGRVVYILGSLEMLQEIMRLAQAQNMTNGDYVFFYVDILGESLRAEGHREAAKPWQTKNSTDTGGLREAFQESQPAGGRSLDLFLSLQTVLVITAHEPQTPEYRRFQNEVIQRAQRDFGVSVNDSMGTLVAGCFHDVLLLYLRALNETLSEGGTKRDTRRILEKMRGLKIQGVTGTVSINSNDNRETDFDLWAMRDVESGEYQVVAHYVGSEKQINWTGPIHWKKGSPPLDNPPCVFDMDDPSCGKDTVGSTLQGQEAEKFNFVITCRETAVCSGVFSTVDRDLSLEGKEGRTPLTWKKPTMAFALL